MRDLADLIHKGQAIFIGQINAVSDLDLLERVCEGMAGLTICPLADAAVMPMLSFLQKFRPEFEALVREPRPAGAATRWPRGEEVPHHA